MTNFVVANCFIVYTLVIHIIHVNTPIETPNKQNTLRSLTTINESLIEKGHQNLNILTVLELKIKKVQVGNDQEKVQVGKDQEKAQAERDSHSKNLGGKKTKINNQLLIP